MAIYTLVTLQIKKGKMEEFRRLHKLIVEQELPVWKKYGVTLIGMWETMEGKEFEISKSIPGVHHLGEVHETKGHEMVELFAWEDISKRRLAHEDNSKNEKLQKLAAEIAKIAISGSRQVRILKPAFDSPFK